MPMRARPIPAPALALTLLPVLLLGLLLSGCDSAPEPSSTASATVAPTASGTASASSSARTATATPSTQGRRIEVTVQGRKVTPPPGRVDVRRDETVQLVITSDVANELHIHGFEIEENLKPGVPQTVTLSNGEPGVYEVELHDPKLQLLTIAVR